MLNWGECEWMVGVGCRREKSKVDSFNCYVNLFSDMACMLYELIYIMHAIHT
jgi:hypothetical protein